MPPARVQALDGVPEICGMATRKGPQNTETRVAQRIGGVGERENGASSVEHGPATVL